MVGKRVQGWRLTSLSERRLGRATGMPEHSPDGGSGTNGPMCGAQEVAQNVVKMTQ